jgi:hypothetical protein
MVKGNYISGDEPYRVSRGRTFTHESNNFGTSSVRNRWYLDAQGYSFPSTIEFNCYGGTIDENRVVSTYNRPYLPYGSYEAEFDKDIEVTTSTNYEHHSPVASKIFLEGGSDTQKEDILWPGISRDNATNVDKLMSAIQAKQTNPPQENEQKVCHSI